jgi:uroporphyrinogen decarboxylase
MKPRDVVIEQIRHRETERVPYTLAFDQVVGERLDRHFGGAEWRSQIVPYVARCGGVARPSTEKIDETHHRDAFGTVWRTDGASPAVVEPGLEAPSFEGYSFPPVDSFVSAEAAAEAAGRVAAARAESFTIVDTGMCLWEAWYVRGFEEALVDCAANEGFFAELLDRMTEITLALVDACRDVEADAIMMGDDWGNQRGVMIGPERWRRLYKPRYARIFEAVHAQEKLAVMHCCGSISEIMREVVETGLDVLESVQPEAAGMDPYELKRAWGDEITFWGCLGTQRTIPFATPDEIRREIRRLRREMSAGGGYILAPAKPLRPETPTANAAAVVEEFLAN